MKALDYLVHVLLFLLLYLRNHSLLFHRVIITWIYQPLLVIFFGFEWHYSIPFLVLEVCKFLFFIGLEVLGTQYLISCLNLLIVDLQRFKFGEWISFESLHKLCPFTLFSYAGTFRVPNHVWIIKGRTDIWRELNVIWLFLIVDHLLYLN